MKASLRDLPLKGNEGKCVFVRVDFNVPLDARRHIVDDTRIRAALPTLQYVLDHGASLVIASHLGRPRGEGFEEAFSLESVAAHLGQLLGCDVAFARDCIGEEVKARASALSPGKVLLLENLRFHKGEKKDDPDFAKQLASLADFYVNDAFGCAHRAHASVHAMASFFKKPVAGFLIEKELTALGNLLECPQRPFVAVLGGAKLKTKIAVVENLLQVADKVILGGSMSYTFFKSQGMPTGASLVDDSLLDDAAVMMAEAEATPGRLHLPSDHVTAPEIREGAPTRVSAVNVIDDKWMGLDIGPETVEAYEAILSEARTVFWNGPMGVFEVPPFDGGTLAVGRAAISNASTVVAGGGETLAALERMGLSKSFSYLSTGGGASLEFIAGNKLPGVEALSDR